ncbi:pseudouridine synthase [Myxococcota bacterium]
MTRGVPERLQRTLARAGVASRRKAEELILAGRIRVGGRVVTELGIRVDPAADRIEVDGRRVLKPSMVYLVLHKPRGVVTTLHDPERRPTVRDCLSPELGRVVPVGRLDFHTSGVLLLTNDGEFAGVLAHPRTQVPRVYHAKVRGRISDQDLAQWQKSILVEGKATQPANVRRLRVEEGKTWLEIELREGKNRQVHRLAESVGSAILRLKRVSFGGITLEKLQPGQSRYLSADELRRLHRSHGVPRKVRASPNRQTKPGGTGSKREPGKAVRGESKHPIRSNLHGTEAQRRPKKPAPARIPRTSYWKAQQPNR